MISDSDVERKCCGLTVQQLRRVENGLEEGVGSWVTFRMLGPCQGERVVSAGGRPGLKRLPGRVAR